MEGLTPRLIEELESKQLGIPHGWYGTRISGTLMTGPCASRDDCLETIRLLPEIAVKPGVIAVGNKVGANDARPAAPSARALYSYASAGRIGYKPSRQHNRQ